MVVPFIFKFNQSLSNNIIRKAAYRPQLDEIHLPPVPQLLSDSISATEIGSDTCNSKKLLWPEITSSVVSGSLISVALLCKERVQT